MANINRNSALEALQGLVEKSYGLNYGYLPKEFNEKQQMALDLFRQRIFLEEVIDESLSFNRKLNWNNRDQNIKMISSAEELIDVYKLRSDVYTRIGYQKECPDAIEGLNFDIFDKNSAILYCSNETQMTGTIKVIYDGINKLPSEQKISFDYLREDHNQIVELSRFVVKHSSKGLNQEFKNLFAGVYYLFKDNDIDLILSSIRKEHYKMYTKFGGVNIEKELEAYGFVDTEFLVLSWNPDEVTQFFKRAFLKIS